MNWLLIYTISLLSPLSILTNTATAESSSDGFHEVISENVGINYEIDITQYLDSSFHKDQSTIDIVNHQSAGASSFKIIKTVDNSIKLVIVDKLDREKLCPNVKKHTFMIKTNSFIPNFTEPVEDACLVTLKISSGVGVESLVMKVDDFNDNPPKWSMNESNKRYIHRIALKDGDPIGKTIKLPLAHDEDAGRNGQLIYSLQNNHFASTQHFQEDWEKVFDLEIENSLLVLKSKKVLDREAYPNPWSLILRAEDMGQPNSLSNELLLEISIDDLNDNRPEFTQQEYTRSPIREDTQVNEIILKVEAKDLDLGKNGQIEYSLESTDDLIKEYFMINDRGEIRLRKRLQLDKLEKTTQPLPTKPFTFKVIARDQGNSPYTLSNEALVTLKLEDVNDEKPRIVIHALKPKDHAESGKNDDRVNLYVEENRDEPALLALIQVSDPDFDGKDTVLCKLINSVYENHFHLEETKSKNEFNLKSIQSWDREKNEEIEISIHCQDSNGHSDRKRLLLHILDLNDNPPIFEKEVYTFKIHEDDGERLLTIYPENEKRNRYWLTDTGRATVRATDSDIGTNSKLRYSIRVNATHNIGSKVDDLFGVDEHTGDIYVKGVLDKETQPFYSFNIHVTDQGNEPMTSEALVNVHLSDVNDNPPSFVSDQNGLDGFSFSVVENSPAGTFIGKLLAIDLDKNDLIESADNETFIYYALENCKDAENFKIDPRSGEITSKRYLDREKQSVYSFKSYALDGSLRYQRIKSIDPEASLQEETQADPNQRVHIVSTNIFITIVDVNDNSPKFIQPNFTDHLIFLDPNTPSGTKIYTALASDPDEGLNGRITYNLVNTNHPDLFSIYSHTGEVYLQKPLSQELIAKAKSIHEHTLAKGNNEANKGFMPKLDSSYPIFIVKLEACDLSEVPKCTSFPNFRIQLRYPIEEQTSSSSFNSEDSSAWQRKYSFGRDSKNFSEYLAIGLSIFFSVIVMIIALIICLFRLKSQRIYTNHNPNLKYVASPHSQTLLIKDPAKYSRTCDKMAGPYETIVTCKKQQGMIYSDGIITMNPQAMGRMKILRHNQQAAYFAGNQPSYHKENIYGNQMNYDTIKSQHHQQNEYQTIPISNGTTHEEILSQANLSDESMSCGSIEVFNINRNTTNRTGKNESREKTDLKPGEPLPPNMILPKSTFV